MEWIKAIIEKHTGEDGKLNLAEAIKEINKQAPDNVVPKEQYNTTAAAKKQLEADVKARDKQLDDLKKAGSVDDLQKQLTEAQDANKRAKKDYDARIADMKYDAAIAKALERAVYPDLMESKIDRTKLKINDDETVTGLTEQVNALKDKYKDQFKNEKEGNKPPNPEGGTVKVTQEQFAKMGYSERTKLYTENKDLYDQLVGGNENG